MEKRPLATLPVASTSLLSEVSFSHPGGEAVLHFEFDREGSHVRAGIGFAEVRAYRFRAEGHCTVWHVDRAYDTLVEVVPSEWIAELREEEQTGPWGRWKIRHFLLYVDSAGAYEVAASAWSWLPEVSVG